MEKWGEKRWEIENLAKKKEEFEQRTLASTDNIE
jgi:hypothetical protein